MNIENTSRLASQAVAASLPEPSLRVRRATKCYRMDAISVTALRDVSLDIPAGRFTLLTGQSGSGKTTLLNLMGCLDTPDSGSVSIAGERTDSLGAVALSDLRARRIGFVFQNFNLLPVLTAYENIEYPLLLLGVGAKERRVQVVRMLQQVGLEAHAGHLPGQLSGGQRQRVAIARALVKSPDIVLADEPTANLDAANGDALMALLRQLQQATSTAIVVSSHDPRLVAHADRVVTLRDGEVVDA